MPRASRSWSSVVCLPLLLPALLHAQTAPPAPIAPVREVVDEAAVAFFAEEGLQRSQVMDHLGWICDVHGPRVTGSPNLRRAQAWAVETFGKLGLQNARTEAWGPFGRGWRCDHVGVAVVGDNPWPVIAYPKVWSPGLPGRIEADVVHVAPMTQEQLEAADLQGKVVFVEAVRDVAEPFEGPSKRFTPEDLLRKADQQSAETQRPTERAAAAAGQNDFRMGFQRRQQMLEIVQR